MKSYGFLLAIMLAAVVWLCCPGLASAHGGFNARGFGGCNNGFSSRSFHANNFGSFRANNFGGGGALNINVNSGRGVFGRRGASVQIRGF